MPHVPTAPRYRTPKKRADGNWEKVGMGEEAGIAIKGIGQDIANSPAADFLRWLDQKMKSDLPQSGVGQY